jgi:cell wall assembly regulator SMI1
MDVLSQLRKLTLGFNPPASEGSLRDLTITMGADLPSEMIELYTDHDGTARPGPLAVRLLSVEEIRAFHSMLAGGLQSHYQGMCALWTDDESNFVSLYLKGPLKGRVCLLSQEDADLSPRFFSVASFLNALLEHPGKSPFFREFAEDYPAIDSAKDSPEMVQSDERAIVELDRILTSPASWEERQYAAFSIMALLRRGGLSRVMSFARDKDMHIQERACELLGLWKHEPAIPLLAEIAARGSHNGISAAILALGQIGTKECLKQLIRVALTSSGGYGTYFAAALKRFGCEVGHVGLDWRYRLPGEKDWRHFL